MVFTREKNDTPIRIANDVFSHVRKMIRPIRSHRGVKQTKLFHSIYEMFFTFLTRKNSLRKTFLLECVRSGAQQTQRKGGNFGAKLTVHLCGF